MPDIGGILRDLDIPWPEGDENALREASAAWHQLAEAIRDGRGQATSAARSLTSNNEGAAIDAFEKYWRRYGDGKGALPLAAEACDALSTACAKYADEIAAAKRAIEEAAAEAGAAVAIGTAGAFFTFGISEAGGDVIAATVISAADSTIAGVGAAAAVVVDDVAGPVADAITSMSAAVRASLAADSVAPAIGTGVLGAWNGAVSAGLNATAENQIRELLGDKPLSQDEVDEDLLVGAGGGAAGGLLGKLAGLGQAQLAALLQRMARGVSDSDIQLSMQMLALSHQVEGITGKIATDVLAKAATQLVTAQQINADKIVKGEIPNVIKNAVINTER